MRDRKLKNIIIMIVLFITAWMLSACADEGAGSITPVHSRAFPVDSIFKEFYQTLGAEQVLGPAISQLELRGSSLKCQFTERALMCFDPSALDTSRFSLYPLGEELNVQEISHVSEAAASGGTRMVDGFVIYEKFLPLYDRLYGARYVGRPLTELRINHELGRVEQFFSNVGFYQNVNDPNGSVFLIPYGAYLCGGDCSYRLNEYWSIVKSNLVEQPFAQGVARLGGAAVVGEPLLQPETTTAGYIQQLYSNVMFYAPLDNPSLVGLRPLPAMLNYETSPLITKKNHDQLVFYEVEPGLGHNVPRPFDAYIARHGGPELSGRPISEVILLTGKNLYRQCFENYCLLFDPTASEPLNVRMAPLGEEYMQKNQIPENLKVVNLFSPDRISVMVSVDKPNLNTDEEQFVRMVVQQKDDGQPLERVEGTLVLNIAGQPSSRFFFPPTDASGMSVVVIPPQPDLEHGTRLSYQVCLNLPSEQPICSMGSYLVWNVK